MSAPYSVEQHIALKRVTSVAPSPDGTWLTYGSMDPKHYGVFRLPIKGGTSTQLWSQYGSTSVSPDGKSVLVREWWGKEDKIRIIPAGGGEATATFDLPSELGTRRWSADSRSLLFVKTSDGVSNIWRLPLNGGVAIQVTNSNGGVRDRRGPEARRCCSPGQFLHG